MPHVRTSPNTLTFLPSEATRVDQTFYNTKFWTNYAQIGAVVYGVSFAAAVSDGFVAGIVALTIAAVTTAAVAAERRRRLRKGYRVASSYDYDGDLDVVGVLLRLGVAAERFGWEYAETIIWWDQRMQNIIDVHQEHEATLARIATDAPNLRCAGSTETSDAVWRAAHIARDGHRAQQTLHRVAAAHNVHPDDRQYPAVVAAANTHQAHVDDYHAVYGAAKRLSQRSTELAASLERYDGDAARQVDVTHTITQLEAAAAHQQTIDDVLQSFDSDRILTEIENATLTHPASG